MKLNLAADVMQVSFGVRAIDQGRRVVEHCALMANKEEPDPQTQRARIAQRAVPWRPDDYQLSPDAGVAAQSAGDVATGERGTWRLRHDITVALGVCLVTWVLLALTASDIGLTYDEPIYMSRADMAARWLAVLSTDPAAALSRPLIDQLWSGKDQHPGLVKLTAAVTSRIVLALHLLPGWAVPLTYMRTGTMFWVGIALGTMYLFLRTAGVGIAASVFAPAAVLFMPRVFTHAHLLALDAPALATCFIAVASAWWALERPGFVAVAMAGLTFGMAIATKLNGFFVPIAVLPYALVFKPRQSGWLALSYGTLGPAVFFLTWPWLWHDTWTRLMDYIAFHWQHWQIGVMYFGRVYAVAPWHYPLVMTAITTPLVPLILALGGLGGWLGLAVRTCREKITDWQPPERLWLLSGWALLANLLPSMLPSSPKYGGVRLFLPVMAWIGVLAALTVWRLLARLEAVAQVKAERRWAISAVVTALLLLPSVGEVAHFHPYGLSAYNALIGGLPGAAKHGFEPTYWGDTYLAAAIWLSQNAPPRAKVWIEPQGMESVVRMYKYLGPLRTDLQTSSGEEFFATADFAVSQNKPTEFSEKVRQLVATRKPAWTEELDGVPLVFVWDMRQ